MRKLIAILGVVGFFIFFKIGFVSGDSMEPTLSSSDLVVVSRFSYPENGDIIAFKSNGDSLVKRVVAGDGEVYDGEYIKSGEYYVLGDNESSSVDSRYFGTITKEQILGVVCFHCKLGFAFVMFGVIIAIYMIIIKSCSYSVKKYKF